MSDLDRGMKLLHQCKSKKVCTKTPEAKTEGKAEKKLYLFLGKMTNFPTNCCIVLFEKTKFANTFHKSHYQEFKEHCSIPMPF